MTELSQPTQKLIQKYQAWQLSLKPKEGISTIHVDEVASKVASFYEKIRGVIEWRDEHLIKKTAIERMLKRRILLKKEGEKITEPLVLELIRGGHFPNDRIEESKIKKAQKIIDKYVFVLENSPEPPKEKQKLRLYSWIVSLAACELEEILSPPLREEALIEYMFELMKERIRLREGIIVIGGISEQEKNIQIYIAVQRALFKLDSSLITYNILKKRYQLWENLPKDQLIDIAKNIYSIWDGIEKDLKHPLADKIYKVCERYDTPYLLLGDIMSKDPIQIKEKISKPEALESLIKKFYNKRLKTLKSRVGRAAIYATLSIFITNIVSLLAIEIPFTKYVMGHLNLMAIGIDILGPTLLMFILVVTVRLPKKENLELAIMEVMKIVYNKERKDFYEIKAFPKRSLAINIMITLLYLLTFFISFGLIIWGLYKLSFPPLSYVIFIAFICLIAFAGVKIREKSKELQLIPRRENFLTFFMDLFSLPILRIGKWLSEKWAKYNVVVTLFTVLIDVPFQVFVEFLEGWRYFLKEKKEEIH
ncbi:hypothetical protein ACFL0A_00555 [Patescibacteria group bacterium]